MTEREIVERERAAYMTGRFDAHEDEGRRMHGPLAGIDKRIRPEWIARRDELFPLPKKTRMRIVADPHHDGFWCVQRGHVCRCDENGFGAYGLVEAAIQVPTSWIPSTERIQLWADLLANPTEEVDA